MNDIDQKYLEHALVPTKITVISEYLALLSPLQSISRASLEVGIP